MRNKIIAIVLSSVLLGFISPSQAVQKTIDTDALRTVIAACQYRHTVTTIDRYTKFCEKLSEVILDNYIKEITK